MKYDDTSRHLWPAHLDAIPCPRCQERMDAHLWSVVDGLVCPRWTRRLARRLADALARLSTVVGGQ